MGSSFDPHAEALVRPAISADDAIRVARDAFGIAGGVHELGSNQDRNFLLTPARRDHNVQRYLLKFDNDAYPTQEIALQNDALLRLSAAGLAVPAPVASPAGNTIETVQVGGKPARARLLTFVEGSSMAKDGVLSPAVIAELGALAGRAAAVLATLPAEGLDRSLQWDLRNALPVVEAYVGDVGEARRAKVLEAARAAWDAVQALSPNLPIQPIHGDITDDNVVGARDALGRVRPAAIIDWGDLCLGWRVAEIAVTVSAVLHHQGKDRAWDALPAIVAFDREAALTDAEIAALWHLVILRGAVLVASGAHQVALEPGNQYAKERMQAEWELFEIAAALDPRLAEAGIRAALGRAAPPPPSVGALLDAPSTALRLDTASPLLAAGVWLQGEAAEARLAAGVANARFAYGEHRLTRTIGPGRARPVNAALFTQLVLGDEVRLRAPFAGSVEAQADGFALVSDEAGTLRLFGDVSAPAGPVAAGAPLGSASGSLKIQWSRAGAPPPPLFTDADALPAWRGLTDDPAPLVSAPPADWLPDVAAERERRNAAVAGAAERYYELPPDMERGWRELLIDTTGRCYLDMVNNVAGIGHGHPTMAERINQQLLTLNTNSRFLYSSLADYVEALRALAPDPSLSVVMLVNSGSEAVDLALKLARAHTGRNDVVALREAYHGWTGFTDAVSTSAYDNPYAAASRPAWVHVADAPNTYRGAHRDTDSRNPGAKYVADAVALLDELDAQGTPVGAFLAEPVFGNGGGVLLPDGYLAGVYDAVRARGGLCISDEVQVGLGRLGHYTWGVEQQGVVPDIIAVAKALGNGYPLGAVYTTQAIADSLVREGMFFSSAGGATASAVAGLAVLDVMRDEGLQANAAAVGDELAAGFADLARRHKLIGKVHGIGLYQGVELVRDRATKRPAVEETDWVCERLLDYGVIMQATSERRNVLKIKPPLTLTPAHARVFLDALDAVLTEVEARDRG
ncbi:hypothetical protein Q8F55_006210 [Vanrija albida]|uniref:Aminoglycoside phosphotransferase domain-containing protein n=1 Tax=Vanrija albida TaxID=181172 RepID=A0ABR3PXE4_9TREE